MGALLQSLRRSVMEGSGEEGRAVSDFKGRHFGGEVVLWAVRWYCRYGISYRDLEGSVAKFPATTGYGASAPCSRYYWLGSVRILQQSQQTLGWG